MPLAATVGLFAAWAVHDAEEWLTTAPWARARGIPMSDRMARTAIAVMGVLVAGAAIDGARTNGRSTLYQSVLLAYGLHGFTHAANSIGVRGYSPGVATVPVAVVPFWLWASSRLERAGIRRPGRELAPHAAAALVGGLGVSYGAAALFNRHLDDRMLER
ncbi:hypothetical protein AXK61_17980 [Tsukamurella pseudospumae]|uniref:HXXEE domain-containing protein n=1 Tax=Tsukamurella pseudospumae TaxID=239498 RepID=A0A137ZLT5_9ACTN|nr:hypothetical protein AXK61_17980 [Tsukamurella pseudospumae]